MTPPTDEARAICPECGLGPPPLHKAGCVNNVATKRWGTDEARTGEPRPSTDAGPGPGCVHVGPIESLAPAEPENHRCRRCYGAVWPSEAAAAPALDVDRLRQSWWNLVVAPARDDAQRWEPDRYNAGHFLQAVMAEYARLSEKAP